MGVSAVVLFITAINAYPEIAIMCVGLALSILWAGYSLQSPKL